MKIHARASCYAGLLLACLHASIVPAAANEIAANKPLLVGYYEQWSVSGPNVHVRDLPLQRMTHLVYESANLTATGEVTVGDAFADIQQIYADDDLSKQAFAGNFSELLKAKRRYPQLKTLISIGGWGRSKYFSRVADSAAMRENFAASAIRFIEQYGFDGVDICWQFPIKDDKVTDSRRAQDPQNFVALISTLRRQMQLRTQETGRNLLLAITVDTGLLDYADSIGQASEFADLISLNTSYIYGSWQKQTQHISALFTAPHKPYVVSTSSFVDVFQHAGVPLRKMIVNVTPFGAGWQNLETNGDNGLHAQARSISWGSWETDPNDLNGIYSRSYLQGFFDMPDYQQHWDDQSKASYLYAAKRFGGHFISYESKQAVIAKIDYLTERRLAGIGIRQLHSDTRNEFSLVNTVYSALHPLHGTWLNIADFYKLNRATIGAIAPSVMVMLVFLAAWQFSRYRTRLDDTSERNRFEKISRQLQTIEWPLIQLYQLAELTEGNTQRLHIDKLRKLNDNSTELLRTVSRLLTETRLSQGLRAANMQAVSAIQIANEAQVLLSAHPAVQQSELQIEFASDIAFYSDPGYLLRLIVSLSFLIFENTDFAHGLHIGGQPQGNGLFKLSIRSADHLQKFLRKQDYLRLKDIHTIARQIGVEVQQQDSAGVNIGFTLMVPLMQNAQTDPLSRWISSQTQKLPAASAQPDMTPTQKPVIYLDSLQHFGQTDLSTPDIGKLLDRACQYFAVSVRQPLKFTIYQGEQQLFDSGDDTRQNTNGSGYQETLNYDVAEFRCLIQSEEPLTKEDIQYFGVLVSQIQLVRRVLQELAKDPVLLYGLYELANGKDRISYIKSDQGYTAIYMSGQPNPSYIGLRLRTIKQYFDDDSLLQIHRSYLVNPQKVSRVLQKTKYRFELKIEGTTLPVSRTHLPLLRNRYPQWF